MFNSKSVGIMIATVAICGILAVPAIAQGNGQGNRGNGQGNQGYGQNRNRGNQGTWQIRNLVDAAERTSNSFRDAVEKRDRDTNTRRRGDNDQRRGNNNQGRGNNNQERFFNDLAPQVRQMDEAFERLRRAADNNRPRSGRAEMTEVLDHARMVDRYFAGNSFGTGNQRNRYTYTRSSTLESRWQDLRRDINALAQAYGMSSLGGGRRA